MGDRFNIKQGRRHDLRPLFPVFRSFNRSNIALVYFVCLHLTKKACHKIIDFLVAYSSKNIKAITKSKICTTKTTTMKSNNNRKQTQLHLRGLLNIKITMMLYSNMVYIEMFPLIYHIILREDPG